MDTHPTPLRDLFLLDPDVIYLNHGSFGATPRPVFERYQYWQRELERQPTLFFSRRLEPLLDEARACLGRFLSAHPDSLAFVTNATFGLNAVIRSLNLAPGDEVLATDHEYGALDRAWVFQARQQGFRYINQPIPLPVTTAEAFVEALWQGVTSRTRVIFLSHITSPTALIFPVEQVCRLAREQGILTIIDGAHAPGQIPLRLDDLGCDFYAGNLHKWLCAPKGAGFLYARPEAQDSIQPLVVSWGWQADQSSPRPLVDYIQKQGTRDAAAFLAVPDAVRFFEEHDWPSVRAGCHALAASALERAARRFGQPPFSPISDEWFAQMVALPLPPELDITGLHDRLLDQQRIEIPILSWNHHKLARLSVQGYNTPAEIDTLLQALEEFVLR